MPWSSCFYSYLLLLTGLDLIDGLHQLLLKPAGPSPKPGAVLSPMQFNSYSTQHARFICSGNCSFNCTVSFMGYAPGCILYARHFSIYGQSYTQNFEHKVKPAKYALLWFHKYFSPVSLFFPMKLNECVKPITQTKSITETIAWCLQSCFCPSYSYLIQLCFPA